MTDSIRILCVKNYEPHEPHTWRTGFLWLQKHGCEGLKEHRCTYDCSDPCGAALYYGRPVNVLRAEAGLPSYEPEPKTHKCMLRLHMYPKYPFINPNKVVLHCDGCNIWVSTDKNLFYEILLSPYPSIAVEER